MPVFGKISQKLIFGSLFEHLDKQKLLSESGSGFRSNDSCTNQLLSIVHDICTDFDADPTLDVQVVFLDMLKTFDKVWHEGLIYKLRKVGISGKGLQLIKSFLDNRFQHIVLNGQSSNWLPVKAGVPQGSILGPLFFLVYINDLSENITFTVKLFGADTSFFLLSITLAFLSMD